MNIRYSQQKERSPEEQAAWEARGRELYARTRELMELDRPLTLKEQDEIGLLTEPELVISLPWLRTYETPDKPANETSSRKTAGRVREKKAVSDNNRNEDK